MAEEVRLHEIPVYTRMTGEVYDLIYAGKDYEGQAAKVAAIIKARGTSGGNDLLEAACGTGKYIEYLAGDFNVEGFDISTEQVEAAQKRLPDARIVEADMLDFEMGKQYDAVICLFSSIGYLLTQERLETAIANFARHTKPGGVVIVEPWLKAENLVPGHISFEENANESMHIARMGLLRREGNITTLEMHHMLGSNGEVEHFLEVHQLAMYTDENYGDAFRKAGLSFEIDPEGLTGRGLYIGVKPV